MGLTPSNNFNAESFINWTSLYLHNITICSDTPSLAGPIFISDALFCGNQTSPSTDPLQAQRAGLLTRLWKAFQITVGINAANGRTAKEQWHAQAERNAPKEEPSLESNLHEIRRSLIRLEQKRVLGDVGSSNQMTSISDAMNLLWGRQWALTTHCDENNLLSESWCQKSMQALKTDIGTTDLALQQSKAEMFMSLLLNSDLAKFKALFEIKNFVVSPELLLASNTQLPNDSLELKKLSELEILENVLSLFDGTTNNPSVASLKHALTAAFELQKNVIIPFKNSLTTAAYLKKHLVNEPLDQRLEKATNDFRDIIVKQLDTISSKNSPHKSILIPGGLAGNNGFIARAMPHLIKIATDALMKSDLVPSALKQLEPEKLLNALSKWAITTSKIAYYEITAQSNGKYTFRIHENKIIGSEPSQEQIIPVRVDIEKDTLLSDPVLRTLVETQLIGDLLRELSSYSLDAEGFLDATWSLSDTLRGIIGLKQINWKEGLIEDDLLPLLGGKPGPKVVAPKLSEANKALGSPEWDALAAILNQFGASQEESQKILFITRLALLKHFCNQIQLETLGQDDKYLTILEAAKETLAKRTLILTEQGIFNENDLKAIHIVISQADQLISRAKEQEQLRLSKEAPFVAFTPQVSQPAYPLVKLPYRIPQVENSLRKTSYPLYQPIDEVTHWSPKKQNWLDDLTNFADIFLRQIDKTNLAAVVDAIELMVEKLDSISAWYTTLTPEKAEQAIVAISEIGKAYFIAHFVKSEPTYSDPKGFATIMTLLGIADDLRTYLPAYHGLINQSPLTHELSSYLFPERFQHRLKHKNPGKIRQNSILSGFRLFDPAWEMRIQKTLGQIEKNEESRYTNLLQMEFKRFKDEFGSVGNMGMGLWRYKDAFAYAWPLGYEASMVSTHQSLDQLPVMSAALFDKGLPYWKAFENNFPDLAKNGTQLEQFAAAYKDTSETSLPRSFYRLRELGTIARYFLKSPFILANGPVVDRNSYSVEFHSVYHPNINIPLSSITTMLPILEGVVEDIKIPEKIRFFPEIKGIDSNLYTSHPDIFKCNWDERCHDFTHTYDPYQNDLLKLISDAKNLKVFQRSNFYHYHLYTLDVNQAMVENRNAAFPGGLDWKDNVILQSCLSHKSTQATSLAGFFATHLTLLEGEHKQEWQAFLKMYLFEPDVLMANLQSPTKGADTVRALDHFCDKGYRYFHSRNMIDEAAFFLDISLLLTRYINRANPKNIGHLKMLDQNTILKTLREKTQIQSNLNERKKGTYAGVLAKHLLEDYKKYSEVELEEIVESTMLYYRYPASNGANDRQRRDAIVKGMHRIASQLKALISNEEKRKHLLEKLVARIAPSGLNTEVVAADSSGLRFASKTLALEIDLLEGRISMDGMGDQTLPFAVIKHPIYQQIFGTEEYLVSLVNPTTWEFTDTSGYACRINHVDGEYHFSRKIDGKHWYQFVPANHFSKTPQSSVNHHISTWQEIDSRTSAFGSLHFLNNYTHWYHDEAPAEVVLLDKQTQQQCYRASLSHSATLSSLGGKDMVQNIYDLSKPQPLKLLNIYNEPSHYQWIENIEDLRHVLIWGDVRTGEPKHIEFPRYQRALQNQGDKEENNEKLSFTIKNNRAFCDQIPDFYLETKQFNKHFPHLKALLVLRNRAGDQKIILPSWIPKSQSALSLRPNFDDVRSRAVSSHNYIVLEKSKSQDSFKGSDTHANLYHSLILQTQHRYSESAKVLSKHGHSPKAYKKPERELLNTIISFALEKSLDKQPTTLIPAMEALVLLIKDHQAHGSEINLDAAQIKSLYHKYYASVLEDGITDLHPEKGAIVARYLLESENALDNNILEQYHRTSETNPIGAHRGLADYAYKKLFLMKKTVNNGFNIFSSFANPKTKETQPSPYEHIAFPDDHELTQILYTALAKENSVLSTGLMLQPTELEFAKEFLSLTKVIPTATRQKRREIVTRCRILQSDSGIINALSHILIEATLRPDLLSHFNHEDMTTIADLRLKAMQHASHSPKKKDPTVAAEDPSLFDKLFNQGANVFNDLNPTFDANKFTSRKTFTGIDGKAPEMPEKVVYEPLLNNWQDQIVLKTNVNSCPQSNAAITTYKKILAPFLSDKQTQRARDETNQLLGSIEAYIATHQSEDISFKNHESRLAMIESKEIVRKNILKDEYDLVHRELEILTFFTQGFGNSEEIVKKNIELAKGIKPRSILEIVLLFARNDLHVLQNENNLSDAETQYGKRLIANYLTVSLRRDAQKFGLLPQLEKLAALNPSEFNSDTEKKLLKEITKHITATPQVDPEVEPAVSSFEFFNHLLVRNEQWDKIHELQEFFKQSLSTNQPKHLIQKLEMGFGKTFLIMPIYAFCAAKGDRLSMSILPKGLIEDMSKEINGVLGDTFGQQLQRLEFDRSTEFTVKRLEDILQTLLDVKKNRQFLMMTSQSVRSFYLKFIETWDLYSKNPQEAAKKPSDLTLTELLKKFTSPFDSSKQEPNLELSEDEQKINLMRQILSLWEGADVLFDEADIILNPKQRLSFAQGIRRSLPAERLGIVTELYRILTGNEFKNKMDVDLEFLRKDNKPAGTNSYTLPYYHQTMKPTLAKMILEKITKRTSKLSEKEHTQFAGLFPELSNPMAKWSDNEFNLVYNFMIDNDVDQEGINFIKNLKSKELIGVLHLLQGELNQILPLTLNRNYNERYGFHDDQDSLAGPYSGSNTANKGSQFTRPWEIAHYTIQAHFKRNDYSTVINQIVTFTREQALKELEIRGCNLDQTEVYIKFQKNIGKTCQVELFQDNAVNVIKAYAEKNVSFQLHLIEKHILPEIKEFPEELSATSQAFSLIFGTTKGFTGTPWNWQTYPEGTKLSVIKETDGATLVPLLEKCTNRVFEVTSKGDCRVTSLFNDNPSFRDANLYIDSGAILASIPHSEVAEKLLSIPWFAQKFDAVIFFDQNGNKMALEKNALGPVAFENCNVPMKQRFTFIDQIHSTGTNILQLPNAKGVISVSKLMILRDFQQGGKRLRQIAKDQRLDVIVHSDDAPVIKEELKLPPETVLTYENLFHYMWDKQLKLMGEENFVSAKHKMQRKLQHPVLEQMKDLSIPPKSVAQWFSKARSLFFQDILDNPVAIYGKPMSLVPKNIVIDNTAGQLLTEDVQSLFLEEEPFKSLQLSSYDQLKSWVSSSVNPVYLDDEINMAQSGLDQESEIEVEQEIEMEQEVEQEVEIEQEVEEELQINDRLKPHIHMDYIIDTTIRDLKLNKKPLPKISYNHARPFADYSPSSATSKEHRITKPVHHLMIYISKKNEVRNYQSMIIDANDAKDLQRFIESLEGGEYLSPDKEGLVLYTLGVGQVSHYGLRIKEEPGKEDPKLLSLIVEAKLYDGEIFYNENEQVVLKNIIKTKGYKQVIKDIKHVLRDQPARKNAFPSSTLAKVLKKFKNEKLS